MTSYKQLGLLFGGVIGDAFGARYEFNNAQKINKMLIVDKHQQNGLLGGGPFNLMPGQVTDDSEMALTLIHALQNNNGLFDQNNVAKNYIAWRNSKPFDIGKTICTALSNAKTCEDVIKNSQQNRYSLSNGCLMRIWPLMYYYYDKPDKEIIKCATLDCMLTHPNRDCHDIVAAYCQMLKLAMLNKSKQQIIDTLDQYNSKTINSVKYAIQNNMNYIYLDNEKINLNDAGHYIGYIGISFSIVLKEFMKSDGDFTTFLTAITMYGGDTDTNCCIGGALFGAYYGIKSIPKIYRHQIMNVKPKRYQTYPFANIANFFNK